MKKEEKKQVAETLTERSQIMRVGLIPFRLRPLTLAQIYEMGVFASQIDAESLKGKERVQVLAEVVAHHEDARLMIKIFLICLFRTKLCRFLFGRYIRKRLTVMKMQQLIMYLSQSINANFFLTSIIFLRQTATITEPSQTTAHGQWSEE